MNFLEYVVDDREYFFNMRNLENIRDSLRPEITTEDLLSRLDMIMRGRVSNVGAPVAYFGWNLPPLRPFSEFVSNPPARDGSLGHRV